MAMNTEPSTPANRALNPLHVSENVHRILSAPLAARQADTDNLIRFAVGIFYRSPRIILAPVLIHPTSVARSSAAWRAPSVGIGG